MVLNETNHNRNERGVACKEVREVLRHLGRQTRSQLQALLLNETGVHSGAYIGGESAHGHNRGVASRLQAILRALQAASELVCHQFQELEADQLKLWYYEKIQEELLHYKDLDKKYNKLQRDLKLYQDGYLKHQSLILLRTKL